ncbi:MAG: carboxypeptidase regulatory-like domain-containing protein [Micromonosporaceae bacterium]
MSERDTRRVSLRRVLSRIGVVVALAAGLGVGLAAPAYAQPTNLSVSVGGDVTLQVGGGAKDVNVTVRNQGLPADGVELTIEVPLGGEGVSIKQGTDGCTVAGNSLRCDDLDFRPNESRNFFVKLQPPRSGGPAAGDSRQGQGRARINYDDTNDDDNEAGYNVTLKGPDKPKAVSGVSGVVTDEETKKPVPNAKVSVKDSAGKEHTTATSKTGTFKLNSTDDQPIPSGALKFTITKSGYDTKKLTKTGSDGENVRVETTMTPKVSASASATPTADEPADTTGPTEAGGAADDEGGTNWLAWLMYLLAAALVLGGIGAIVWLFRRRDEGEDEEYESEEPGPRGPTPGARGAYHTDPYGAQTTVMGGAQPTTVMGADQPTSMINPAGIEQPTSMIDRTGIDQPTMSHPGPLADGGDDVYPAGRESYAPGSGYGPDSGYGRSPEPDYGADPGYGSGYQSGHQTDDPGYGGGQAGDPGYGAHQAGSGHQASDPGYGSGHDAGGSGGGRHSAADADADPYGRGGYGEPGYGDRSSGYGDQGGHGERPASRPGRGRHSAGDDDHRLDWYED